MLHSADDMCSFISDVAKGIDRHAGTRGEVRDLTNYNNDGRSAERVAGFLVERLNEKRRAK